MEGLPSDEMKVWYIQGKKKQNIINIMYREPTPFILHYELEHNRAYEELGGQNFGPKAHYLIEIETWEHRKHLTVVIREYTYHFVLLVLLGWKNCEGTA